MTDVDPRTAPTPPVAAGPEHWPSEPPMAPPVGTPSGTASAVPVAPRASSGWGAPGDPTTPTVPGAPAPTPPRRTGLVVTGVLAVVAIVALALFGGSRLLGDRQDASSTAAAPSSVPPSSTPTRPSTALPADPTDPTDPSADPTDPSTGPSTGSGSGGAGAPVDEAAVKAEVAKLQTFVERERGLTYQHPVEVKVLASEPFKARVLQEFDASVPAMQKQGELLKAAGLVPADLDVVKAQKDLLGSGVLGFYDPKTKALFVRGDHIGPMFREITAHELTHALDDQHFNLDRPEYDTRTDGSDWSFLALVEGSARKVEYAYKAQMSPADKEQLQQEELELGMEQMGSVLTLPMILPRILMAPYDYGNPFVKAVLAKQGQAALDKAFATPPTSSEQILDEAKFEQGEGPKPVDRPPADGEVVTEGTLGELMTGFLLHGGDSGGLGGLGGLGGGGGIDPGSIDKILGEILDGSGSGTGADPSDPTGGLGDILGGLGGLGGDAEGAGGQFGKVDTVTGWGGDHYVVYRSGAGSCMRADWKMDTPAALTTMTAALRTWAQTSGATVESPSTDTVRMTRCSVPQATPPTR